MIAKKTFQVSILILTLCLFSSSLGAQYKSTTESSKSERKQHLLTNIIETISNMKGEIHPFMFTFVDHIPYFDELGKLIDEDSDFGHSVIEILVDNLDNLNPSKVTNKGKVVPLGVACYEVLRTIVCYEGDIDEKFPHVILPNATADQLRSAKREWQKIVKKKWYIFL